MSTFKNTSILLGRLMVSASFILSLIGLLTQFSGTIEYAKANGVTMFTEFWVWSSIILEFIGVVSLLSGYKVEIGALSLLIFLIPVTFIFHHFWTYTGMDRVNQTGYFFSNTGLIGGLLLILGFGAGKYSIDFLLLKDKKS